jgi:hypothetical protein
LNAKRGQTSFFPFCTRHSVRNFQHAKAPDRERPHGIRTLQQAAGRNDRQSIGRPVRARVRDAWRCSGWASCDPKRQVAIVISQFRAPIDYRFPGSNDIVEAIAGIDDEGNAQDCAKPWRRQPYVCIYSNPSQSAGRCRGISTETMKCLLAPYSIKDRVTSGGGIAHENEEVELRVWPLRHLAAHVGSGAIVDMKLLVLVQALRSRRPELF